MTSLNKSLKVTSLYLFFLKQLNISLKAIEGHILVPVDLNKILDIPVVFDHASHHADSKVPN